MDYLDYAPALSRTLRREAQEMAFKGGSRGGEGIPRRPPRLPPLDGGDEVGHDAGIPSPVPAKVGIAEQGSGPAVPVVVELEEGAGQPEASLEAALRAVDADPTTLLV